MEKYILNTQTNEVHKEKCPYGPKFIKNIKDLGRHKSCLEAISYAKNKHSKQANGCGHCCP